MVDRDIIMNVIDDRKDITTARGSGGKKGVSRDSPDLHSVSLFMENKFGVIEKRLTGLEHQINRLDDRREGYDATVLELLKGMEQKLSYLEMILKNREKEEQHDQSSTKTANKKKRWLLRFRK